MATEPLSRCNTAEVNVIRTRDRLTAEDLLANLEAAGVSRVSATTVGRYTLYAWVTDALCVSEPGVVLCGNPGSLTKVLRRDGPPELSEEMKASLKAANFSQPLAVAFDPNLMRTGGRWGACPDCPAALKLRIAEPWR